MHASPSPDEAPFEIVRGGTSDILLLCDHASNALPERYGSLGLPPAQLERHIGYDIGARAVTLHVADLLGATAVLTTFSRLLVDPNRGEDDPTVVMRLSDGTIVPGNHPIARDEVDHRIAAFHRPYHDAISGLIDAASKPPIIVSIHSFTPAWKGIARPWEIGILWDADPRMNIPVLAALGDDPALTVGDNEPYAFGYYGDTIHRHATTRGLANTLIELRQDEIASDAGARAWAERLAPILAQAGTRPHMHDIIHHGSRFDGTAKGVTP